MLFKAKKSTVALGLAVLLLSGLGAMQAFGDDDGDEGRERGARSGESGEREGGEREGGEGRMALTATNATWQAECSACHIAYPADMLPAASWKEMMGTLDKHFGTDASMDEKTVAEILPFLEQNADPQADVAAKDKPVLRITETGWFKGTHEEIGALTWKKVKSASDCAACHTTADKGDFSEDNVHIPKSIPQK